MAPVELVCNVTRSLRHPFTVGLAHTRLFSHRPRRLRILLLIYPSFSAAAAPHPVSHLLSSSSQGRTSMLGGLRRAYILLASPSPVIAHPSDFFLLFKFLLASSSLLP